MAENLTKFVLELAQDPQLASDFRTDPAAAMQRAGLSQADVTALQSGNAKLIRQALAIDRPSQVGDSSDGITVVVLTWTRMPSSVIAKQIDVATDFETRVQQILRS